MPHKIIEFNWPKFIKFKRAYNKATKELKTVFTFENNKYATEYAKYLIEYLNRNLKK